MEPLQRVASDEDARLRDQRQERVTDSRFLQMEANSPHLDFQDSNLSPALSLLPSNSAQEPNFSEYSLFHQSDTEFAPLRAYPDISVASGKFHIPPHEFTTQTLDQPSLSQHPLAEVLSEEGGSSCCSLSQHSLSPEHDTRKEEMLQTPVAPITHKKGQEIASKVCISGNLEKVEDTYFLSKDVPAQHLMQILQKDVGVLSSSCSSNSSSSSTSAKKELKSTDKPNPDQSLIREGPPGEASVSEQQPQTKREPYTNESKTHLSDVFNVSVGSRSTKPDDSSEALRQELLLDAGQVQKSAKTPKEYITPFPTELSKHKPGVAKENLSSASCTGPFSTGVQQRLREHDLWSSGNQTGIDGSYLSFLPQSQSTPGVFKAPPKSSVKSKFQQLSDIESNKESSIQSSAEISPPPLPPAAAPQPETKTQSEEEPTCDKVQSLPSLNYMQKVDAWRANQSTGKTSLFDSLALQGFTGVSPKKKAYEAVSDSLNRILTQQLFKMSQNIPQNPSMDVSTASSLRREEAVGSAPSDKDNTAATQPASPFNRSQSHSSLSTVVMSVKKEQATEARIEKDNIEEAAKVQQHPTTEGQLSPLVVSLGQFSDATLSNSQDSSNSGQKVATSIGTSSVSLEVDNYDPYWTSKLSTPPPQYKPRELNIEERIPLYLQNLGINQSPSTILTPFAPRGPIREPEFSPTELCTIKGSTPTKSIQPSEGGTPHKAEFSRSSLQSVDSSVSIPLSTDGQVIRQELFRASSSSSNTSAAIQSARKLHPNPNEDVPSQQQRDSSQSPVYSGPLLDQDMDKELESHQVGPSAEQNAEISFVSSSAFSDIRKLLSQAEDMVSPRSSAASDRFLSQRKEQSFTSAFSTEESKSQTSHLWTRSSSDSLLTTRGRLTGGENVSLVPAKQTGVVSRSSGLSLVLTKTVQRAEPEGCSAAPPDRIPPPQPLVKLPSPSTPIVVTVPEETKDTSQDDPVQSRTPSPVPVDAMSDRSSESSLAIRVTKLLQTESPATMVSSTTSVDQEEGKAREWIRQMVSGQKCEPLELDQEDRRRIEEIKRELLLKNPKMGYASTDTESSFASSHRDPSGPTPFYPIETLPKILDSKKQLSQHSGSLSTSVPQPNSTQREDIVARVREIAAREGVTLPKTRALTSITISTCRRSTSPSPSTSPAPPVSPTTEPLHLNQLTTEEDGNKQLSPTMAKEEQSEEAEIAVALDSQNQKSQLAVRQDTVGGQFEDSSSSSVSLEQDKIKGGHLELVKTGQKSADTESSSKAEEVTTKSGHISHVRLTLSPKPLDHALDNSPVLSRDFGFPQKHFVPLRHASSMPSSPDEGVGLSSPPEWHEVPGRSEKIETNKGFMLQQQRVTSSTHVLPKLLAVEAIVPHLLPYKPHGSEELFYVPQTEADSSTDTTMESTHTGSDDALPPRFSSDVLGQQDPGLDRGVTIRHTEGIYSKRLTKPRITMTEPGHRASPDAVTKASPINISQTPKSTSPVAFTRAPLSNITEVPTTSRRDQGTSPVPFFTQEPPALDRDKHQMGHSVHLETHYSNDHLQPHQDVLSHTSQQNVSTLDQLWQRFTERWSQEESRSVSDREASLLERLERLSRLIHSTRDSTVSEMETSQQELYMQQKTGKMADLRELKKQRHANKIHTSKTSEMGWKYRHNLDNLTPQVAEDSHLLSPAERDASDTMSSTSMSTVDTARLVRAFGANRVQRNLRTSSSSLSKLYTAISKQKEQEHEEKTRHRDTPATPSETSGTNESSVVVDSASSTSTYTRPPHHGPSKSLVSKKAVKLVSKGIQAGDLEIVSNGTRRHTRDVGTTFPSPSDARGPSSFSSSQQKSSLSKTQKQKKSQKSPSKHYPEGVSWFISADELKAEARKENEPEEDWRPSSVWFEPFSKKHPWREPLRQRQVEDERNTQQTYVSDDPHLGRKKPSSLAQVSLQDALLAGRPEFVSRSRQRLERLALQVEERRLQALFSRERDELFVRPGAPGRLPRPAGTAQLRRAVPRKEMIQRSKQIYENLPEVRRRKEEERRKAEYTSYRLNAQLYNKRITNRVLGRRTAWH